MIRTDTYPQFPTNITGFNGSYTVHYINVSLPDVVTYQGSVDVPGMMPLSLIRSNGTYINAGAVNPNPSFISRIGSDSRVGIIRWVQPDSYMGYTCSLWPCMKTMSAEIVAGQLRERVESETGSNLAETFSGAVKYTQSLTTADLDCVSPEKKQVLRDLGYNFTDSQRWLPYYVRDVNGTLDPGYDSSDYCSGADIDPHCQLEGEEYRLPKELSEAVPARCMYVRNPHPSPPYRT